MTAGIFHLLFEQGVDYPLVVNNWTADDGSVINFTGYSAELKIRPELGSSIVLFDMTTANGAITINGTSLTADFPGSVTQTMVPLAAMPAVIPIMWQPYLSGVYELRVTSPGGIPTSLFRGNTQIILGVI